MYLHTNDLKIVCFNIYLKHYENYTVLVCTHVVIDNVIFTYWNEKELMESNFEWSIDNFNSKRQIKFSSADNRSSYQFNNIQLLISKTYT